MCFRIDKANTNAFLHPQSLWHTSSLTPKFCKALTHTPDTLKDNQLDARTHSSYWLEYLKCQGIKLKIEHSHTPTYCRAHTLKTPFILTHPVNPASTFLFIATTILKFLFVMPLCLYWCSIPSTRGHIRRIKMSFKSP